MILLDTNVVSELMKAEVDPSVAAFVAALRIDGVFLPSLVVAEIRYGLRRLPAGRRRDELEAAFAAFLDLGFAGRILPFDAACAEGYAEVRHARESAGRRVAVQDALIGGMARAHGALLLTRNIGDFDGCRVDLLDPWLGRTA